MTKEIISKIVDSLYETTNDSSLNWKLKNSMFNSEKRHCMHSFSTDDKTEFSIDIRLDDDLNIITGELLSIHNKSIVDGVKYISSYDNKKVKDLELIIFEKYIKPNIILNNTQLVYEDILNSIGSKEYIRDKKLESILGEEKIEEEVKEVKKKKYFLW